MLLNCQFHQQYRIIKNVFFWIWTQRTWTSASDRYSHPVLYFILNIRIHIISGKFRLRSNPRVRFLFSQIFHDERHRSFSMSTLFISSNLSRDSPPHPCFLWSQDAILPCFTVVSFVRITRTEYEIAFRFSWRGFNVVTARVPFARNFLNLAIVDPRD